MEQVKDIIDSVIGNLAKQGSHSLDMVENIWHQTTDAKIQQHTKIGGLKDQKLIIYVDSSPWLYQLNFKKNRILKNMQEYNPEIQGIIFKLGKVL